MFPRPLLSHESQSQRRQRRDGKGLQRKRKSQQRKEREREKERGRGKKVEMVLIGLIKDSIYGAGYTLVLLFQTILQFRAIFFKRNEIIQQMFTAGISSFFVVSIVAVFTGMIMGLNVGLGLKDFGAEGQESSKMKIKLTE